MTPKGYAIAVNVRLLLFSFSVANARLLNRRAHRSDGLLSDCNVNLTNATFTGLLECVRDKSLTYLDRVTATDSIDLLGDGAVMLVRRKDTTDMDREKIGCAVWPRHKNRFLFMLLFINPQLLLRRLVPWG